MILPGELGLALREARLRSALTQSALARRMGTSQSAIARAESGLTRPSLDFIERFLTETGELLRVGSLIVLPSAPSSRTNRTERVRRAIGDYEFDPWTRKPTPAERKSLEAQGLTREHFKRSRSAQ
ncbi:MAG: helix-turn-helix domain-containing protein [Actinomycetota bacterium]